MRRRFDRAAILLFTIGVAGCSADAAPEPEPRLTTPGAFIAIETSPATFDLYRTLAALKEANRPLIVFAGHYGPTVGSFDEARELSKDTRLRFATVGRFLETDLEQRNWRVVWFRTLTDEESGGVF
jgi:hypothetical protein